MPAGSRSHLDLSASAGVTVDYTRIPSRGAHVLSSPELRWTHVNQARKRESSRSVPSGTCHCLRQVNACVQFRWQLKLPCPLHASR